MRLRYDGYRRALAENNIPIDRSLVISGDYGYRKTVAALGSLIESRPAPDAVFVLSDRMAAGAISALASHGIRVPEDTAVMGFDNTDLSYIVSPGISTVAQPQLEMGVAACRMLTELLDGKKPENIFLKHELIIRGST